MKRIAQRVSQPSNVLPGSQNLYGVMPDWNPAEIIGLRSKPLALSLYRELVIDSIWVYQRDNYGYRNMRSYLLVHSFFGLPYVDVKASFSSFIPKTLHDQLGDKLLQFYLDRLIKEPKHHDKIEFEIVHSCYYLNLPQSLQSLERFGFNDNERKRIEFSLLGLTNRVIDPQQGLLRKDLRKVDKLQSKYLAVTLGQMPLLDKVYWLLEDCKRYGTLPFARIARAAFMAVQFLESFVQMNIWTPKDRECFLGSLCTVFFARVSQNSQAWWFFDSALESAQRA